MTNSTNYNPHQHLVPYNQPPYSTNTLIYQQQPSPSNGFDNYSQAHLPINNHLSSQSVNNNNLNNNMNLNLYPYNPPQPGSNVSQPQPSFPSGSSYNPPTMASHTLNQPQSEAKEPPKQSFPSLDMNPRKPISSAWHKSNDYQPNNITPSSASTSNNKAVELANERVEDELQPAGVTSNNQKAKDSLEEEHTEDKNEQHNISSDKNERKESVERKVRDSGISSILKKADSVKKEKRHVRFNLPEGYSEKVNLHY